MASIYLVEDDPDYADTVIRVMTAMGHTVVHETETAPVLDYLNKNRPDLLILDIMFPEDSFAGLDLARALKNSTEPVRSIPILLLSAVNEKYSMGFSALDIDNSFFPVQDFLDKSVDLDVLQNKVTRLLSKKP